MTTGKHKPKLSAVEAVTGDRGLMKAAARGGAKGKCWKAR